jgi:hypothetical protein
MTWGIDHHSLADCQKSPSWCWSEISNSLLRAAVLRPLLTAADQDWEAARSVGIQAKTSWNTPQLSCMVLSFVNVGPKALRAQGADTHLASQEVRSDSFHWGS